MISVLYQPPLGDQAKDNAGRLAVKGACALTNIGFIEDCDAFGILCWFYINTAKKFVGVP